MKKTLLLTLFLFALVFTSYIDISDENIEVNNLNLPFDPMVPESKDGSINIDH
ncbi:hypothetical protein ACSIGC_00505 [Tenacibaculum sp. ZS6-P6]|uniref:hypothetical protein n=1 Tax=Tenacibaculum sp. ZS6-P6 TaxID=3447503 RepID=UPI003F964454